MSGRNPFEIVPDSSLWVSSKSFGAVFGQDCTLYVGTVRLSANDADSGELRYTVEIMYRGHTIPVACRMVRRFGGAFNYEDIVHRGYSYNTPMGLAAKAGDQVLVGLIGGQGREGVILGGLTHPTRKNLDVKNGPEYKSEFNGIETYINKDGEWTQTFRAQPTNLSALDEQRTQCVPPPEYDTEVGSSYAKWDKTGSYTVCDNATSDLQKFFIDKKAGTVELISGKVSLKFDKAKQQIDLISEKYVNTCPAIYLGNANATEQAVLGTTYREKENTCNSTLSAKLSALSDALKDMFTYLNIAGIDPVFLGICSAAAAAIGNAATAAQAGSTAAKGASSALDTFEGSKDKYLSNVVKVK